MKRILIPILTFISMQNTIAQDTVQIKKNYQVVADTIIVTQKSNSKQAVSPKKNTFKVSNKNKSINYFVIDIGYAGFRDYTHYNNAETQSFLHNPGGTPLSEGDFSIKHARISNFNLWLFLQSQNLFKQVIKLKYGFGIETNNYYYKTPITYVESGNPYVIRDIVHFSLNKLATDYFTAPLYLQFNTMPNSTNKGLKIAFGASIGYLYNARQKQISDERGTQKNKTDFNITPFKVSYIAEVGLGKLKFYGSLAATALHKNALNQMPFTVGIRLSAAD